MWAFKFIYGEKWISENLCRDGFITEKPDGSRMTWHTDHRDEKSLRGLWQKESGEILSRHAVFFNEDEITEAKFYTSDIGSPFLTYSTHYKSKNVIDVIRKDKDGNEVKYRVIAKRSRSGRVISYKLQFSKENPALVSLKYNKKGLLIEERLSHLGGTRMAKYEYDNQGTILLQRMKVNK